MNRRFGLYALVAVAVAGCAESPVTQPVRSLEQNGEVSFFCASVADGRPVGADIHRCPDRVSGQHHLFALVTQTLRGEVALIDLDRGDEGEVVDVNPSVPGYSFLPVGEQPVDIVSTPGGTASFVAVAAPNRSGIFALPTSCISAPRAGEPVRDITTWPACALPVAPRDMTLLVAPDEGENDPRCGLAKQDTSVDQTALACPADLTSEGPGVRKLVVTLPERGSIAIIDAQWLLNRPRGTFQDCLYEERPLTVDVPSIPVEQPVPPDLVSTCPAEPLRSRDIQPVSAYPVKQAFGHGTLYIADLHAPVIHRLDVSDPCNPVQQPSLLPQSVEDPARLITVRDVAVSPETTRGQRFVYAIEGASTGGTAPGVEERGGIMVFDVSPGSTSRAPLVRPGSLRTPYEPPDRILFSAPARAITFAERDVPEPNPVTGSVTFGELCDPDPRKGPTDPDPAIRYRPAQDLSRGAGPRKLRGIFGFAALSSGQVAVIDVEDWDAACRRPVSGNTSSVPDFRGCAGDAFADYINGTTPTVSNEVSCNLIQPHRARMANYAITSDRIGLRAPTLRALPRLSSTDGGLVSDNTFEGRVNPKLLAVDFEPRTEPGQTEPQRQPAQVYVGTSLYTAAPESAQSPEEILDLTPATAQRNSLVLPLIEPRSYASQEDFAVVYEGRVTGDWQGGRWDSQTVTDSTIELRQSGNFCDSGVEDETLMQDWGERLQVAEANLAPFGRRHADYVQILSKLLDSDNSYWRDVGPSCSANDVPVDHGACLREFGPHDAENLDTSRDLRIKEAYQDRLVLEPRDALSDAERRSRIQMLRCCFPQALTFTVRASHQWIVRGSSSGFRHDVWAVEQTNPDTGEREFACKRNTCDPTLRYHRSRAFEISQSGACPAVEVDDDNQPGCIGPAGPEDYACVIPADVPSVQPGGPGSACIFENLTARFAIYRGDRQGETSESQRDMVFTWQTVGGYSVLAANIVEETSSTSPRSMTFVPQLGQLAVVDGRLAGLAFISLSSLNVSRAFN